MEGTELDRPAATSLQGWILVSGSWLAVMAPALIAPVLPRMTAVYKGTPHEPVLIALAATLPALFVALLAIPSGVLADRIGSRKLLLLGLAFYAAVGTAPLWLRSLPQIVFSRAGVGIAEALILTTSTALLVDSFAGDRRAHWLALQTGSANIVAIAMTALSGALGDLSWRTPFLVYGISLIQFPLVLVFIRAPRADTKHQPQVPQTRATDLPAEGGPFRWSRLIGICLVTTFASTAFYLVVVQLGFLLTERGTVSPRLIGRGTALAVLSLPLGAYLSRLLRMPYLAKMALSFVLSCAGFAVIALAHTYAATVAGGVITDFGSGLALTTLITWALAAVPMQLRGRVTGAWQSAFAFGQFASPLLVLALASLLGGRSHAVLLYAGLCGVAAIAAGLTLLGQPGLRLKRP